MVLQFLFNSLENEPGSVSHQGVYSTVERNRLARIWRDIYRLHFLLLKIESIDANKAAMRSKISTYKLTHKKDSLFRAGFMAVASRETFTT